MCLTRVGGFKIIILFQDIKVKNNYKHSNSKKFIFFVFQSTTCESSSTSQRTNSTVPANFRTSPIPPSRNPGKKLFIGKVPKSCLRKFDKEKEESTNALYFILQISLVITKNSKFCNLFFNECNFQVFSRNLKNAHNLRTPSWSSFLEH